MKDYLLVSEKFICEILRIIFFSSKSRVRELFLRWAHERKERSVKDQRQYKVGSILKKGSRVAI